MIFHFTIEATNTVPSPGIEPEPSVLQTDVQTHYTRTAWTAEETGIEPASQKGQPLSKRCPRPTGPLPINAAEDARLELARQRSLPTCLAHRLLIQPDTFRFFENMLSDPGWTRTIVV